MTAPGGRGQAPDPTAPTRRRPSIAVADLMSGTDGPSSRRRAGDGYPPPAAQHASAGPPRSHSVRASPAPSSGPPPPPHHNTHSHPSMASRREFSPPPLPPEGRRPSSTTKPGYSHSHPGAPPGHATPSLYDGPHPSQRPPSPLLRHRTDPVDDRRIREHDVGRPYEHNEDPRRMPMGSRYDYHRDYPPPDRPPPQRDGRMYPSPSPPFRPSGPSASASAPPLHDPPPPHAYPMSARGPPPPGLAPAGAEGMTGSPPGGSTSMLYDRGPGRPRSPHPVPPGDVHSRGGRDDPSHGHPPSPPNVNATYSTPAPRGMRGAEAAAYARGYQDAMEAVRHGVVWIGDKLYSQIPMYVPDAAEWTQPADGRRPPPHDSHPSVERGYGRPPPWDERDVKREDISPYGGPSRSHSAPVPRASLPPYPSEHYRHSGPPGYAYPPPMEHGPPHYPVHMGGPPMGPYMGPDYSSPYFTLPIRPQSQQMRSRQQISCHPCRNRKVKCSGTTPCEACVKIKREDECVYEKTVRRRGKGKKAGTGSEENGEHKLESTDERQSDDERRDASTSPVRERKDVELRDERERQDGDRESRDGTRKRARSRPTSPHRRTAPAPRRMRESP